MARPLRIEYPGAYYHVTSRGNERRAIFADDTDKRRFLEILETTSNLFGAEVHGYVLMENHFHLILMTPTANLQKFMQRFNTSYTVYFNRRHHRTGHLFQGRYKALLIDRDTYLLELSRYLHLNPVRIKKYSQLAVEKKRRVLQEYPWSSYRGYTHLKDRLPFVTYSTILEMIGRGDDTKARSRYSRFVMSGIVKDMNSTFWDGVKGQAILGSDEFVDWVRERFLSYRKDDHRELPGLRALEKGPRTIQEIAREVAAFFGVEETELYRRYASVSGARALFVELCCLYLNKHMSLSEIGRTVGNVSAAALSQQRKRLSVKMRKDHTLQIRFEELKKRWE
jgi:REP element-mobilizing transposase RayT